MQKEAPKIINFPERDMMPCCSYQRSCIEWLVANVYGDGIRILNIGCKEDPASLGDWANCVNLDAVAFDPSTQTSLVDNVNNFVHADFLDWTTTDRYDVVVIGEVLEHCTDDVISEIIRRVGVVLDDGGYLVVTCPFDDRPKYTQYSRHEEYFKIREGITSWHQNILDFETLSALFEAFDYKMVDYQQSVLDVYWAKDLYWNLCLGKKEK